jgi:uncharacterized protein (DUF1778 family)
MATPVLSRERRTEKLDLRISSSAKKKLQEAASSVNRSVSEFVMESALTRAEATLADRRVFPLDAKTWTAFVEMLDAPPKALPKMQALMDRPSVFGTTHSRRRG